MPETFRFATIALAAGLLVASVGVLDDVAVAGAYSDADCRALSSIEAGSSPDPRGAEAKALAGSLASAARRVKNKKLKGALETVAAFYGDVGDAQSEADVDRAREKSGPRFIKAALLYIRAATKCESPSGSTR